MVQGLKRSDGISENSMKQLAASKVHGLIDGAYTDDLGLAQAVAAGATEVVAFLDSNSTVTPFKMQLLFKDAPPNPSTPDYLQSVVFQESADFVAQQWENFHSLSLNNTQYLQALVTGSFTATTANNEYFGISKGQSVTIHVVQTCADVTIGYAENINNYNVFTQEVIQTLVADANKDFVQNTLLPIFVGS